MITFLETVSDLVFLSAIIILASVFVSDKRSFNVKIKKRLILSLLISSLISILFSKNYFVTQSTLFKWLLLFLNFSKYFLLASFIYKIKSFKLAVISTIIQFICSSVTSGILILIPMEVIHRKHLFNILFLLVIRIIIMFIIQITIKNAYHEDLYIFIEFIPTYIYVFILFSLFLLSGIIQTINYDTSNISLKLLIIKIIIPIFEICLTVIIMSLMINVISKKYQSNINTILEKQIATQLYHYEQLEKMNIEIRRFKHDYINHVKCMDSMLASKEYDDLSKYFHKISESFPNTSYLFETGNYIADAILTEKQVNSPDNIFIEFDGVIPKKIDNTDLCVILSNALDNAVEACRLCGGDKIINVYSGFKHGYFVFKIKNPTVNTNANGKITTTKSDKINHGFGLANIKRTVKKYEGYVSTSYEDNTFTLNITFSSISDSEKCAPSGRP